ncbi:hypothetical protein D3C76_837840 [compost metagenome]
MPPAVVAVHVVVVVFPVARPRIVGRVNIDAVHLPGIEVVQQLQGVVVVSLDQRVPGCIRWAVGDGINWHQGRKDRLAKLAHYQQLINRKLHRFGCCASRFTGVCVVARLDAGGLAIAHLLDLPDILEPPGALAH